MPAKTLVHIYTTNWMQSLENVDGLDALYLGDVADNPNLLAVIIKATGGLRFFCKAHKRIFTMTSDCPDCAGVSHAA